MSIQDSLKQIRATLEGRIARELAQGEGVRAGFFVELTRFFDLLEQTIISGDMAWLDPVLYDWSHSPTETSIEGGEYQVSFALNRIIALTIETSREHLSAEDALALLGAVMPIYAHSLSVVARYEMETRVEYISKQLDKMNEKLKQADASKANFISVAAHELKTPLTLIEGYTSMMIELSKDPQSDSLYKGISTGIKRMRRIIEDMLDVSLIDNNLLTLNIQSTSVAHLLRLVKTELQDALADRKQTLTLEEFEGLDTIIDGDSERLYQAIHNVVTNAIKYTPDQGSILISGRLIGGFVEITVKDSGIGISPEHQAFIFENFGQLGRTNLHSSGKTKFKGGGPGLGLPITRGILEAHGGNIWVESEGFDEINLPGSTFHILLPTRKEVETEQSKVNSEK